MKFLSNVLACILGLIIFSVLAILIIFGMIAAASSEKEVVIEPNSVLHLKLDKPIVERTSDDPFSNLEFIPGKEANIGLIEMKEAIQKAAQDDNIKGIYLESRMINAGFATLEEIRNELLAFKKKGKFVVYYGDYVSEADYYLASAANELYMHPEGALEINGLKVNAMFLKGTFEKLQIEPEIFRVGEFKGAVEPFIRKDLSEENRLQLTSLISNVYANFLKNVSETREIEINTLKNISDSMLVRSVDDAIKYKVITGKFYQDQVENKIKEKLNIKDNEDISFVKLSKYNQTITPSNPGTTNKIAVIVATGEIVTGEGQNDNIGSEKFVEEIRKARKDDKIKAVVLRINSPGGDALASDVIWREVQLTQKVKPVIASMSDMAASGGYYIAMASDTIVAQPNTITGSIGVFGMMFNAERFLENKLGITHDVVKTGQFSDLLTFTRPLTEGERQIIQQQVNQIYYTFTSKAAEGRGMTPEALREVAAGRVWSGVEAKDKGLVDVLGGLDKAVEIAAKAAKLKDGDFGVRYYPQQKSFFEQIVSELENDVQMKVAKIQLGEYYYYLEKLKQINNLKGIQARMPFEFGF